VKKQEGDLSIRMAGKGGREGGREGESGQEWRENDGATTNQKDYYMCNY